MTGSPLTQTHGSSQLVPKNEAAMTQLARTLQQIFAQRQGLPWFKNARPISSQVCQVFHCPLSRDRIVLSFGRGRGQHQSDIRPLEHYKELSCIRKVPSRHSNLPKGPLEAIVHEISQMFDFFRTATLCCLQSISRRAKLNPSYQPRDFISLMIGSTHWCGSSSRANRDWRQRGKFNWWWRR